MTAPAVHPPDPPDTPSAVRHIVVVGGGITGLAAAYTVAADPRARASGIRCTLVEADGRLGGKIRTERVDGCIVEHGPDSFLATKPWAADLCRAVGLGDRLISTQPGRAVYVWCGGRLHPLPEGLAFGIPTRLAPMIRTGLLSPLEKLRAAADLVLPRRTDGADETIGGLLRRRLGGAVVDRLAGPLLGGIYAGDPDDLSVRATFPLLVEWEARHRSLILAALARRRARAAGAAPAGVPPAAVEHHGAGASRAPGAGPLRGPSPMFLSLVGGLGDLVDRLQDCLAGTEVLLGRRVRTLTRRPSGDGYRVGLDDGRGLEADAVLLAVPAYAAAALLETLVPAAARTLRATPYVSTAAVTLAFRRTDLPRSLDGHGFVVARGEPLEITACTWISSKWPHRAPPDLALIRCYLGRSGRETVVEDDDDRLLSLVRADLRTTMGLEATPVFTRVARWVKAMPQYPPGHHERLAALDSALAGCPGLRLAGAGYRGIGIPDCVRQGTEAAAALLASSTRTPAVRAV